MRRLALVFLFLPTLTYASHLASGWYYHDYESTELHTRRHDAFHESINEVETPDGNAFARLHIVNASDLYGADMQLKKGHFDCGKVCKIDVQFDDSEVIQFDGSTSDLAEYDLIIQPPWSFIDRVRTAEKVKITADIRGEGRETFDFQLTRLEWPRDDK